MSNEIFDDNKALVVLDFKTMSDILEEFGDAPSMREVLARRQVSESAFFKSLSKSDALWQVYVRARWIKAEIYADEVVSIADTETDYVKARNRITSRQWYASKIQPDQYGDKINVNVTKTVDVSSAIGEAHKRRERLKHVDSEIEDAEILDDLDIFK